MSPVTLLEVCPLPGLELCSRPVRIHSHPSICPQRRASSSGQRGTAKLIAPCCLHEAAAEYQLSNPLPSARSGSSSVFRCRRLTARMDMMSRPYFLSAVHRPESLTFKSMTCSSDRWGMFFAAIQLAPKIRNSLVRGHRHPTPLSETHQTRI